MARRIAEASAADVIGWCAASACVGALLGFVTAYAGYVDAMVARF